MGKDDKCTHNHQIGSQNGPGAPLGRLPWGRGKNNSTMRLSPLPFLRFWDDLGNPLGDPWGPISPFGPSQDPPKKPGEPILRQLGRVSFWTLFLDPKNQQKS